MLLVLPDLEVRLRKRGMNRGSAVLQFVGFHQVVVAHLHERALSISIDRNSSLRIAVLSEVQEVTDVRHDHSDSRAGKFHFETNQGDNKKEAAGSGDRAASQSVAIALGNQAER